MRLQANIIELIDQSGNYMVANVKKVYVEILRQIQLLHLSTNPDIIRNINYHKKKWVIDKQELRFVNFKEYDICYLNIDRML